MKLANTIIHSYLLYYRKPGVFIIPNITNEFTRFECDLLKVDCHTKYTTEIEVKISRSDFFADFKKGISDHPRPGESKHEMLKNGLTVNKFYFCVPAGLITVDEIPDKYGLIYYYDQFQNFKIIKEAKFLHKNKLSDKYYERIITNIYYKYLTNIGNLRSLEGYLSYMRHKNNQV